MIFILKWNNHLIAFHQVPLQSTIHSFDVSLLCHFAAQPPCFPPLSTAECMTMWHFFHLVSFSCVIAITSFIVIIIMFLPSFSLMCATVKNVPLTVLIQSFSKSDDKYRTLVKTSSKFSCCCQYQSTLSTKQTQQMLMLYTSLYVDQSFLNVITLSSAIHPRRCARCEGHENWTTMNTLWCWSIGWNSGATVLHPLLSIQLQSVVAVQNVVKPPFSLLHGPSHLVSSPLAPLLFFQKDYVVFCSLFIAFSSASQPTIFVYSCVSPLGVSDNQFNIALYHVN